MDVDQVGDYMVVEFVDCYCFGFVFDQVFIDCGWCQCGVVGSFGGGVGEGGQVQLQVGFVDYCVEFVQVDVVVQW